LQQSSNVYFLGKLILAEGSSVSTDRLGSVRAGGPGGLGYQAQYPYGVEYTLTANDREKYATYTRDSLTWLDYAVNRYYSSQWGRFLSPDPSAASTDLADPGSWNQYSYGNSDPVNHNDPTGLDWGALPGIPGSPGFGTFGMNLAGCLVYEDVLGSWGFMVWDEGYYYAGPGFLFGIGYYCPNFAAFGGGGGGSGQLVIRNLQKSGRHYDQAANTFQDILKSIDPDCLGFLQSGGNNLNDYVSGLLSNGLLAVGDFVANIAAFTGTGGTNLPPGAAAIVVNNNGAFFSSNFYVDQGSIVGGTPEADVFILLHELGHALGANGFQNDYNNKQAGKSNDQLISQHCQKTLGAQ